MRVGVRKNWSVIGTNGNCKYLISKLSPRCASSSCRSSSMIDGELISKTMESNACPVQSSFKRVIGMDWLMMITRCECCWSSKRFYREKDGKQPKRTVSQKRAEITLLHQWFFWGLDDWPSKINVRSDSLSETIPRWSHPRELEHWNRLCTEPWDNLLE